MARLLIDAIYSGDESLASDIIHGGTYGCIDSQTSRRDGTALFFACSRGYVQLVKILLSKGASPNSRNKCLATPLHAAVDNGHEEIVRMLLDHGADVNAQTYRGDTSLHLAAYRGYTNIAKLLVQVGADHTLVNSLSITAQHEAMRQGHLGVASLLQISEVPYSEMRSKRNFTEPVVYVNPPSLMSLNSSETSPSNFQQSQPRNYYNRSTSKPDYVAERQLGHQHNCVTSLRDQYVQTSNSLSVDLPGPKTHTLQNSNTKFMNSNYLENRSVPMHIGLFRSVNLPEVIDAGILSKKAKIARKYSDSLSYDHLGKSNSLGISNNITRRVSDSCYEELGNTNSVISDASSTSDVSSCFGDTRPEELDFQDKTLGSDCLTHIPYRQLLDGNITDRPASKNYFSGGSSLSESSSTFPSGISSMSQDSITNGLRGPESLSSENACSMESIHEDRNRKEGNGNLEQTNRYNKDIPLRFQANNQINRSLSTVVAQPVPDKKLINRSLSVHSKPSYYQGSHDMSRSVFFSNNRDLITTEDFFPGYEEFPSNDLSSVNSSINTESKGPESLTFLNIPFG